MRNPAEKYNKGINLRISSKVISTIGLYLVIIGFYNNHRLLIGIGLISLILSWYLLDFYYYRKYKEL